MRARAAVGKLGRALEWQRRRKRGAHITPRACCFEQTALLISHSHVLRARVVVVKLISQLDCKRAAR